MEQEFSQIEDAPIAQPVVEGPATTSAAPEIGAETEPANEPASDRKQDPWKTAFIVLIGVVMLSAVLIYSTSSKRTEPTTVLQTDANGQPVQPLNPASGIEEERLAALPPDSVASNTNVSTVQPGQLPGGDNYDPWANGGKPPTGAPVGPGGGYVTIPNGGASQFMPPECIMQPSGIYLCPVPTNANTAKPTPTPKGTPNANVQASPTPVTGGSPKPTPSPAGAKPSPTPKTRSTPTNPRPAPTKTPELD